MNKEKIIIIDIYDHTIDVYPLTSDMINVSTYKILLKLGFDPDRVQSYYADNDFTITIH